MKVTIIGGGELGSAFRRGLGAAKIRAKVAGREDRPLPKDSELFLLCVRKNDMHSLCQELLEEMSKRKKQPLVVSMAAGIRLATLQRWMPKLRLARAMPNIAVGVNRGRTAYTLGRYASKKDGEMMKRLLDALGGGTRVKEPMLDVAVPMSGSAVAYYFYFAKEMQEYGIRKGMKPAQARLVAKQALESAALLANTHDIGFDELIAQVATPGGITRHSLDVLDRRKTGAALREAMEKAREKSEEVGDEMEKV